MKENNRNKAKLLLERYCNGRATSEEEKIIQNWFAGFKNTDQLEELPTGIPEEVYSRVLGQIQARTKKRRFVRIWKYAAAAAVILAVGVSVLLYLNDLSSLDLQGKYALEDDVLPGGNVATLILEDGSILKLDAGVENEYQIEGVQIDQSQGVISFVDNALDQRVPSTHYNTIRTENGGQYTVILPDGSTVKLNANSSLRFPTAFGDTRKIALEGEAYFDVKRNESSRFIVEAGFQQVEVLGTQFNIKSYAEEQVTTTALVSGSLRVISRNKNDDKALILKPGDLVKNGPNSALVLERVERNKVKAWQEGEFYFDGENLEEIMAIIARWYDVEVVYVHKPSPRAQYGGVISRNKKLSTVLSLLGEKENLKFEIKGKEVIVKK